MSDTAQSTVQTPDGLPLEQQPRWRKDFPIDVDEDSYVARRDFAKFLVLTSLAFVAGQFWILVKSLRRRTAAPRPQQIIASANLAVGGAVGFAYPQSHDSCVLVRTGPDQFVAYGAKCTHLACAVLPDVEAGVLRCPCHHGLFDLATGRPLEGPPRRPLVRIHLERRGDDIVATGVEERTV